MGQSVNIFKDNKVKNLTLLGQKSKLKKKNQKASWGIRPIFPQAKNHSPRLKIGSKPLGKKTLFPHSF